MRTNGFTLIEMLVVLSLIAILAAVVLPAMDRRPAFIARGQLVASWSAKLSQASRQARLAGQTVTLDLGDAGRTDALSWRPELGSEPRPIFYPDGSSNGGALLLDGRPVLHVAWIDGAIDHDR